MALTCTNCNATVEDTAKFCSQCGTAIASAPAASPETEQSDRIIKELGDNSPGMKEPGEVFDFEKYRGEIIRRAQKYTESATLGYNDETWMVGMYYPDIVYGLLHLLGSFWSTIEHPLCMPTNKPYAHQALFMRIGLDWFRQEAVRRRYLHIDGTLALHVIDFFKERGVPENEMVFVLNNKEVRKSLDERTFAGEQKDDELFPPPQPLRVEVAGTVMSFTTWDAALVVYMDCAQKGKEVTLELIDWYAKYEAKIIERTEGGTSVCAAIFPRIPIVRDCERYLMKVVNHVQAKVKFRFPSGLSLEELREHHFLFGKYPERHELREEISLFKGNVVDIDWRGQEGRLYFDEE